MRAWNMEYFQMYLVPWNTDTLTACSYLQFCSCPPYAYVDIGLSILPLSRLVPRLLAFFGQLEFARSEIRRRDSSRRLLERYMVCRCWFQVSASGISRIARVFFVTFGSEGCPSLELASDFSASPIVIETNILGDAQTCIRPLLEDFFNLSHIARLCLQGFE